MEIQWRGLDLTIKSPRVMDVLCIWVSHVMPMGDPPVGSQDGSYRRTRKEDACQCSWNGSTVET